MQAHRRGAFPLDLVPELAELGVFGANLSDYGCAGMSNVGYGLVMQARCMHAWLRARTVLQPATELIKLCSHVEQGKAHRSMLPSAPYALCSSVESLHGCVQEGP